MLDHIHNILMCENDYRVVTPKIRKIVGIIIPNTIFALYSEKCLDISLNIA